MIRRHFYIILFFTNLLMMTVYGFQQVQLLHLAYAYQHTQDKNIDKQLISTNHFIKEDILIHTTISTLTEKSSDIEKNMLTNKDSFELNKYSIEEFTVPL